MKTPLSQGRPGWLAGGCLVLGGLLVLAGPLRAGDRNTASFVTCDDMATNYWQIQEQLHAAQVVQADKLAAVRAADQSNAAALTIRLQALEATLARLPAGTVAVASPIQRTSGWSNVFGLLGLGALLFTVIFQRRARARPAAPPPTAVSPAQDAAIHAVVEAASARWLIVLSQLEERIKELEARPLPAPAPAPAPATEGVAARPPDFTLRNMNPAELLAADLLAEGDQQLAANLPQQALECFDQFLATRPGHAEALLKRASALEKLGREAEALAGYEQAVAADYSLTLAHLGRGRLLHQLQRYDEAVNCFEQALFSQDHPAVPPR